MADTDRLVNLLGAFGLAVGDRVRAETEAAVGHSGAAAAALVMIAQFPGRTVEFLRRASASRTRPPCAWSTASWTTASCAGASPAAAPRWR